MSLVILLLILLLFGTSGVSTALGVTSDPEPASLESAPLVIEGEPITRLALANGPSDVAYVASDSSIFWRQAGGEWERVGDAPPAGHLVFDHVNPDVLMTGVEDACYEGGPGATLQISEDGGATWQASTDERAIRPLAIWSGDDFAVGASCAGLHLSSDLGATWGEPDSSLLGLQVTAFAVIPGEGHRILAGLTGEGGTTRLYHFDLDATTPFANAGPVAEYWGIGAVAATEEIWYLASITGISRTTDGGDRWITERAGLEDITLEEDPATAGLPANIDPSGMGLSAIALRDGQPFLVGGQAAIYRYWNTDVRPADAPTWEALVETGSRVTAFLTPMSEGPVLAQAEDGVWEIGPEVAASS